MSAVAHTQQRDRRGLPGKPARLEPWVLPALLVLAALLRLPDLATRGTWDGDQGHDMLVLRSFVRDGVLPLLGPPTSIGDVHHGAWYYYLLSPVAALTGGDSPLAVVAVIAVAGIAAVGVVWWLGRSIGGPVAGPVAGAIAGLALATSTAAIDESTFIWNPNLIALASAVALAGAWRAWTGATPRWWLLAALGTAVTMQSHVLGVALLPIVGVPFVLDARRRALGRVPLGVLAIFVAAYLPLAINELTTGFSEMRAAIDYLGNDRTSDGPAIPVRFGIVGLRVVSWPLVGLITTGFVPAVVVTSAVIGIVAWLWRRKGSERATGLTAAGDTSHDAARDAARWYGLGLLWSAAFLTIAAPTLAAVIPGLPNDHYHAFADPMVVVLVGIGAAAIVGASRVGSGVAFVGLVALVGWNVTHLPPAVHPDGGYPGGQAAGDRVMAALARADVTVDDIVLLRSLPDFKSTEAVAYPLIRAGQSLVAETPNGVAPGSLLVAAGREAAEAQSRALVLLCDDLFTEAIGAACGGPAENAAIDDKRWGPVLDQFEAHPGRWITVYGSLP